MDSQILAEFLILRLDFTIRNISSRNSLYRDNAEMLKNCLKSPAVQSCPSWWYEGGCLDYRILDHPAKQLSNREAVLTMKQSTNIGVHKATLPNVVRHTKISNIISCLTKAFHWNMLISQSLTKSFHWNMLIKWVNFWIEFVKQKGNGCHLETNYLHTVLNLQFMHHFELFTVLEASVCDI